MTAAQPRVHEPVHALIEPVDRKVEGAMVLLRQLKGEMLSIVLATVPSTVFLLIRDHSLSSVVR